MCAKWLCVTQIRSRRVPKFYLIMLRTAVEHLSRVLARQCFCAPSTEILLCVCPEVKLSSLIEEIKGKEGQEHFQVDLMKSHCSGWAGNHSSTHSAPSSFIRRQSWTSPKNEQRIKHTLKIY